MISDASEIELEIANKIAQGLYEDYICEEYEKLIFDYLASNCKEFDDEHIKQLVDLKIKQYERLEKENDNLKNVITEITDALTPDYEEYKKYIPKRNDISDLYTMYWLGVAETSEYVLGKLKELKGGINERATN